MLEEYHRDEEMTEAGLRALLNEVVDPCSRAMGQPLGLDDMGLIEDVAIGADFVRVTLLSTSPLCLMAGVFLKEARERLAAIADGRAVDVRLDARMLWTPDRVRSRQTINKH